MPPALIILTVLLLALVSNAAWGLATSRPVAPITKAVPTSTFDQIAGLANTFAGRHVDGSSHAYSTPVPLGAHECGIGLCRHTRTACSCGMTKVSGPRPIYPEVR